MKLVNTLLSLFTPSKSIIIFKKIIRKFFPRRALNTQGVNIEWLHSNELSFSKVAKQINGKLWEEAKHMSNEIKDHADYVLSSQNVKMGGGGMYPFLYFLK